MYCKAKKKFRSDLKIFENLLHKKGQKGWISKDGDSWPPIRYVLLRWYLSPSPYFFSDWLWPYCVSDAAIGINKMFCAIKNGGNIQS